MADPVRIRLGAVVPTRTDAVPLWLSVALALMSLSILINYIDRGNLATASTLIKNELHLSPSQLGFLLTAFFITYAPAQAAVGWLVDRFDAGRVLVAGFGLWSVATCLTGFAQGFAGLLALRLLLGLGESVAFPVYANILATFFPESKRGFTNACITGSMTLGPAFGIFFGGMLIADYGWRAFFIGFGLLSLLWIVPWLLFAQPHVGGSERTKKDTGPNFVALAKQRSLWGASLGHFCGNYAWYFLLTWIPYYLVNERHWSLKEMATIGGIAYLFAAISNVLCGWLTDRWIAAGASPTLVRKGCLVGGLTLGAIFMMGCVASNAVNSVIFLMLAGFAAGFVSPNLYAVAQTLAGATAAGRWIGLQNMLGNLSGIVAPALTGVIVERTGNFLLPFTIAAAVSLLGALSWLIIVGPVRPIDWPAEALRSP